jgi:hypothetical protein
MSQPGTTGRGRMALNRFPLVTGVAAIKSTMNYDLLFNKVADSQILSWICTIQDIFTTYE